MKKGESTPHARGSTIIEKASKQPKIVYPACAGIHPNPKAYLPGRLSLPRMRGDPPCKLFFQLAHCMSTPHARGSTHRQYSRYRQPQVYPACAGIDPIARMVWCDDLGLPRTRGDLPFEGQPGLRHWFSTPHARGSTSSGRPGRFGSHVYPACAGIHLFQGVAPRHTRGLPRMRGDPPHQSRGQDPDRWSTPHARGSTAHC